MAGLSKEAFAVMAVCEDAKQPFGITVDKVGQRSYRFMWAFKIDRQKAHREGYDAKSVTGSVDLDTNYPGCPYCGNKQFYICGKCHRIVCWHGHSEVTCPDCGNKGAIETVEELNLKGGGY